MGYNSNIDFFLTMFLEVGVFVSCLDGIMEIFLELTELIYWALQTNNSSCTEMTVFLVFTNSIIGIEEKH